METLFYSYGEFRNWFSILGWRKIWKRERVIAYDFLVIVLSRRRVRLGLAISLVRNLTKRSCLEWNRIHVSFSLVANWARRHTELKRAKRYLLNCRVVGISHARLQMIPKDELEIDALSDRQDVCLTVVVRRCWRPASIRGTGRPCHCGDGLPNANFARHQVLEYSRSERNSSCTTTDGIGKLTGQFSHLRYPNGRSNGRRF